MINIDVIKLDVERTIKAWQNEDSRFRELTVDGGNIAQFINEVNDTVVTSINTQIENYMKKRPQPTASAKVDMYESKYYELKQSMALMEQENEKLTQAIVNLALKLKDVE